MNNNYHTQIGKNTNMLNEIAANNHLLQQQMQNFQGTPINRNIPPQSTQQLMQTAPQLMQSSPQQNQYNQLQANYPYQQSAQTNNPDLKNTTFSSTRSFGNNEDDGDLELSDGSHNLIEKNDLPMTNTQFQQPQQLLQQLPQQLPLLQEETANVSQTQQINNQIHRLVDNLPDKQNIPQPHPIQPSRRNIVPRIIPVPKKENATIEYIIIPALLILLFVGLVHPKTSGYLEKYLPPMTNLKNIAIRGAVLAILYLVIRIGLKITCK